MSDDEKKPPPIAEAPGKTVTFKMQWNSYNAGEAATFNEVDAKALIDRGIATEGGEGKPPDDVPEGVVFSAVAGIEHPPRIYPPNPQHPEIPQTFDPSPLHQLQRTARDQDAKQPGLAAREELEKFEPDPSFGAGPQPMRRFRPQGTQEQRPDHPQEEHRLEPQPEPTPTPA